MSNFFMRCREFVSQTNKLILKKELTYKDVVVLINIFTTSFHYADNKTKYSNMNEYRLSDALGIESYNINISLQKLIKLNLIKKHYYYGNEKFKTLRKLRKKHPKAARFLIDIRYEILLKNIIKSKIKNVNEDNLEHEFE